MSRAQLGHLCAIVAIAILGVLVGRASSSAADRSERQPEAVAVPVDNSPAAVAMGYLAALRWDVLIDDAERRRVIAEWATPEAAERLDADLAPGAEALRDAVRRQPVVARRAVLGYRVLPGTDGRIVVRIWGVALFASRLYEPTTQWSTSDLTMVRSGDRWLVDAVESRGGPSPRSALKELAHRARGLEEVRNVP